MTPCVLAPRTAHRPGRRVHMHVTAFAALAGIGVFCSELGNQGARASDTVHIGPSDVASVFFIAKNQNKNQVHYGIHLDGECQPVGTRPVFAYWQMLEKGGALEPLLGTESPAYGLDDEQGVETGSPDRPSRLPRINAKLRAFRDRPLTLTVTREGGTCKARATATIAGAPATLSSIYVHLHWPFGVAYVLITGTRVSDGHAVSERVQDDEGNSP